ncbi:MAG: hypothetical protein A2285_08950 [Elusimicrobia bacterium RIFOXYA12_FULL_57_11]|nr:MAG: hypothetical protein A2285_08950 [Elusimicrobia bacterium RIFOXYA12_FULL_57_11]
MAAQVSAFEALKVSISQQRFEFPVPPAAQPALYKSGVSATPVSGEELFAYLHEATAPAAQKTPSSYKGAKAFMYSKADNTGCGATPGIVTFYSQICVKGASENGDSYKEQGDQNGDGVVDGFINAEHIWPQGYFNRSLPMVADLHHLSPTFVTPNGRRANYKFGVVAAPSYATSAGSKLGKEIFEPTDAVKGNVARAMLYFVVRYYDKSIRQGMNYDEFWIRRVPMLLEWNRQDPPDANELRRNGLVEGFQGNRNPFIDNPSLADQIGAAVFAAH